MEQRAIRGLWYVGKTTPDFIAFHPGYARCPATPDGFDFSFAFDVGLRCTNPTYSDYQVITVGLSRPVRSLSSEIFSAMPISVASASCASR